MSLIFAIIVGLLAIGMTGGWIKEGKRMMFDFEGDDWFIYIAYVLLEIVLIFF